MRHCHSPHCSAFLVARALWDINDLVVKAAAVQTPAGLLLALLHVYNWGNSAAACDGTGSIIT